MPELVDTTNMTASEIENVKVSKQKEYQVALKTLHTVELAELEIARKIIKLQEEKKDYQIAASKARPIVRMLALDVKILDVEFWRTKDGR